MQKVKKRGIVLIKADAFKTKVFLAKFCFIYILLLFTGSIKIEPPSSQDITCNNYVLPNFIDTGEQPTHPPPSSTM